MKKWLSLLIPRFETDTVVLQARGDELHIVCSYENIGPGEMFDGMCELKTFTWLNWSFPSGEPFNVRSFEPKVAA
ncbi:hypothetical protein EYC94_18020 [Enterobacter hormaechei]|nr:hypothetical protein AM409_02680 [Enterobacter cloacae complex sp.]KAA0880087.1 hypothetical protein EYC94_18020 [Enterobacter hormaechei]KLQ47203.1 hypothetical protein ABF68_21175 [Enterobacter hormaechei subsp. steigerwaltii]RTM79216.1 hypothetical protein EKO09_22960 [Enterobacter hormaechei subsp. xiangfangensis]KUR23425.1 hypothetical protein AWI36_11055 [Enterobacter hormaechei subsp. steigerwaltii]